MSKERARRRAEREREQAIRQAARARVDERRRRRARRRAALTEWVPRPSKPASRQTGILARRRRQEVWMTVGLLVLVNVLVWVFVPGWAARAMALAVTVLVAPVVHLMLFRRT